MDFNIRPISKSCAVTGDQLQPGHKCWSVLSEVDGKLIRQDISEAAWEGPPENSVGHWLVEIPEDPSAGKRRLDTESLFEYFVQLSESPNNVERDYQYVLSLLLMRKRRLILESSVEVDEQPAMRLLGSGGEGPFDVVERELTDEQVGHLQQQLFGLSEEAA